MGTLTYTAALLTTLGVVYHVARGHGAPASPADDGGFMSAARRQLAIPPERGTRERRRRRGGGERGHGRRGGRRHSSSQPAVPPPVVASSPTAAPCGAGLDDALLSGTGCDAASPDGCATRYVLIEVLGNGRYLAPWERGVVRAGVRKELRGSAELPLAHVAWRVVPVRGGWVRLLHVQSGGYLRLVPPPDPVQWVFRVERDAAAYGEQTLFRFETEGGQPLGDVSGAVVGHVRAHGQRAFGGGAYLNWRGDTFVRGHGSSKGGGGAWAPAARGQSTRVRLEAISLRELVADAARFAEVRAGCVGEPCGGAAGAPRPAWREACGRHFAPAACLELVRLHAIEPGINWGAAGAAARNRWARLECGKYATAADYAHFHPAAAAARAAAPPPPPRRAFDAAGAHCAAPVDGVVLLVVSDRPNQFLCGYVGTALLHGLRPTVLGWDEGAWLGGGPKKPWMFHLGAKLLLPLAYLRRCAYPNSTLVLFTDHDVVFQGGIAALKTAYAKAVAAAGGNAPLIFSAEYEPYPGELRRLYPRPAADAVFGYLNSGMWIGPAGAAMELLASMAGETGRGEKEEALWAHYLNWGALPGPAPRAFAENDQFAYAGFFVAQRFADACGAGPGSAPQLR